MSIPPATKLAMCASKISASATTAQRLARACARKWVTISAPLAKQAIPCRMENARKQAGSTMQDTRARPLANAGADNATVTCPKPVHKKKKRASATWFINARMDRELLPRRRWAAMTGNVQLAIQATR
jgi:hypothetical protein